MKNIKTILFDADDTLWQDSVYFRTLKATLIQLAGTQGISEEIVLKELDGQLEIAQAGEQGYATAVVECARNAGYSKLSLATLNEEVAKFLNHPIELLENVKTILSTLPSVKKILLTKGNFHEQISKLIKSDIFSYFDNVIVLERKTAKKIEVLLKMLELNCDECLVVGNSIKHDIIPSVKNNINCIWFNHDDNYFGNNEILPDNVPEVNNWLNLGTLLKLNPEKL